MQESIQEISDLVKQLNSEIEQKIDGYNSYVQFKSNGKDVIIKFLGDQIWQSWEEGTNREENENLEMYIRRRIDETISDIFKLKGEN